MYFNNKNNYWIRSPFVAALVVAQEGAINSHCHVFSGHSLVDIVYDDDPPPSI